MDLNLKGRVALVTGGSRGIGFGIAKAFAAEGCEVHIAATNLDKLQTAASELSKAYGVKVTPHAGDLTKLENVEALAKAVGDIDILVNNAGAIPRGRLDQVDPAAWRKGWDLKVFAYIDLARFIFPGMCARKRGVIINVIGLAGERPVASSIAVSTANAALMMFTACLGGEGSNHGVRVVGVNPGAILSDRLLTGAQKNAVARFGDKDRWPELFHKLPGGRPGHVEEVADVVAFLASDRASYVNGDVLRIDAGLRVQDPSE
jgi:NAD(P)-dependent dehydrogenase (short-subunit alcohol dehydrogenase family)